MNTTLIDLDPTDSVVSRLLAFEMPRIASMGGITEEEAQQVIENIGAAVNYSAMLMEYFDASIPDTPTVKVSAVDWMRAALTIQTAAAAIRDGKEGVDGDEDLSRYMLEGVSKMLAVLTRPDASEDMVTITASGLLQVHVALVNSAVIITGDQLSHENTSADELGQALYDYAAKLDTIMQDHPDLFEMDDPRA